VKAWAPLCSRFKLFVICTTFLACVFLLFFVIFLFLILVVLVFFLVLHVCRFINMCGNIKLLHLWSLEFLLFCVIISCSFFFTFGLLFLFLLLYCCCCPSILLLLPSLWCMHVSLFDGGSSFNKNMSFSSFPPLMPLVASQLIVFLHGPHYVVLAPLSFPCIISTFTSILFHPVRVFWAY